MGGVSGASLYSELAFLEGGGGAGLGGGPGLAGGPGLGGGPAAVFGTENNKSLTKQHLIGFF